MNTENTFPLQIGHARAERHASSRRALVASFLLTLCSSLAPAQLILPDFSDAKGWTDPAYYSTIQFPDINGDKAADVCGRGADGIYCALADRVNPFHPLNPLRLVEPSFSDANGWKEPMYYSTIHFADISGDGIADVCGRGWGGIWCAVSEGGSGADGDLPAFFFGFGPTILAQPDFSNPNGWSDPTYYSTIRLVDVNGDGKADVCGRGKQGIWCALSTTTIDPYSSDPPIPSFAPAAHWTSNFDDADGWGSDPAYYSTIQFADVNGDGLADVCGRGYGGIYCALSNGASFGPVILVAPAFSDANGWNAPGYYSTIHLADVNGDGKVDICGRGIDGIYCALSTDTRYDLLPSFAAPTLWTGFFSDGAGWNSPEYYSTILFVDIDKDHKADVCGRGPDGVMCARSTGTTFGTVTEDGPNFSDANGWNSSPAYYSTIRLPDINGDGIAGVCGRGTFGIWCDKF